MNKKPRVGVDVDGVLADMMTPLFEVMNRLWSEDDVTFEGRHYQIKGLSMDGKPVQQPRPCGPRPVRRTAHHARA